MRWNVWEPVESSRRGREPSLGAAREHLRVARALATLPQIAAAFAARGSCALMCSSGSRKRRYCAT